jgi:hypothetical protein
MDDGEYIKNLQRSLLKDIDLKNNEINTLKNRIKVIEKDIKFRQKQFHNEISDYRKLKSDQKDSRDIPAISH